MVRLAGEVAQSGAVGEHEPLVSSPPVDHESIGIPVFIHDAYKVRVFVLVVGTTIEHNRYAALATIVPRVRPHIRETIFVPHVVDEVVIGECREYRERLRLNTEPRVAYLLPHSFPPFAGVLYCRKPRPNGRGSASPVWATPRGGKI